MKRLSEAQVTLIAQRGRALADPTRVRILDVLARTACPVGQIAGTLGCEPSTISKHLQVLFQAGLVDRRRAASMVIYSLRDATLPAWCRYLSAPRLGAGDG
jgi:DNA-binding transcriptional ArsR family regulator